MGGSQSVKSSGPATDSMKGTWSDQKIQEKVPSERSCSVSMNIDAERCDWSFTAIRLPKRKTFSEVEPTHWKMALLLKYGYRETILWENYLGLSVQQHLKDISLRGVSSVFFYYHQFVLGFATERILISRIHPLIAFWTGIEEVLYKILLMGTYLGDILNILMVPTIKHFRRFAVPLGL